MRYLLLIALLCVFDTVNGQSLKDALRKGDTTTALQILTATGGPDAKDAHGSTALMTACRWADDTTVRFLLQHGARADEPRSPKGRTPLMVACAYYSGNTIVKLLLSYGADPNAAADDGTTALMLAAQNAKVDVIRTLLSHKANHGAKDDRGRTAIDYARAADIDDWIRKAVKDTEVNKDETIRVLEAAQ